MKLEKSLRPTWCAGQLLAFSAIDGLTSYEDGLVARTTVNPAGIEIRDPAITLIQFEDEPLDEVLISADFFRFKTASGYTSGVLLDAHHLLIRGACKITSPAAAVQCLQENDVTLVGVRKKFNAALSKSDLESAMEARRSWLVAQSVPDNLAPETNRTLFRALAMMKGQVCSPEGKIAHRWTTPDRWPHKDMWLWDTGFHAIGWRHFDPALAKEMILAMFDAQQPNGFLPHRVGGNGTISDFTQPPILAYAIKLVHETAPDIRWVQALFPKLAAYIEWDLVNRDSDGAGLAEWFIEEDPVCRSGESGMDNSPRFDCAQPLDAVDFNSFLALECETLSELAAVLGLKKEKTKWKERHRRLCRLINDRLWSDERHFYFDYNTVTGEQTSVLSSAGFLPLICGAASEDQAKYLARHIADPDMFATAFPIPSIAVRDLKHYAKDMWRGPTWVNINWLVANGFERYGMLDHADHLRTATIMEVERTCEKYGTFFEYFDDRRELEPPRLLRKGVCAPELNPYRQVIHEFGWTATLYADLIMQKTD